MLELNNIAYELNFNDIKKVMHTIINKLDVIIASERTRKIKISLDEKTFPSLYAPTTFNEDVVLSKGIDTLLKYKIFNIEETKKDSTRDIAKKKNAKLVFNYDWELSLRDFYNHPIKINGWDPIVCQLDCDQNIKNLISNNKMNITGKSDNEIINQLKLLLIDDNRNKSVRHVSAKYFWGISKALDNKEQIIEYCKLKPMPVLLHVKAMSNDSKKILFIENLDTYTEVINSHNQLFKEYILIYSSGFKASAKRLRIKEGSRIFFEETCCLTDESRNFFKKWLYMEENDNLNTYFWGDLDFAGINILSSLRKIFPHIKAWEMGYQHMLQALMKGEAHSPDAANKENQIEPNLTIGCEYTDLVLIPALKYNKLFVDQEYVNVEDL